MIEEEEDLVPDIAGSASLALKWLQYMAAY